jgi:hypothetical protein
VWWLDRGRSDPGPSLSSADGSPLPGMRSSRNEGSGSCCCCLSPVMRLASFMPPRCCAAVDTGSIPVSEVGPTTAQTAAVVEEATMT